MLRVFCVQYLSFMGPTKPSIILWAGLFEAGFSLCTEEFVLDKFFLHSNTRFMHPNTNFLIS